VLQIFFVVSSVDSCLRLKFNMDCPYKKTGEMQR
jgi:hypothetical protein